MGKKKSGGKPKWNRAHFFQRKKSTKEHVGHPAYIYQTRGRNYKYLIFTHKPKEGDEGNYEELKHNIDPDEKDRKSYVKKTPAVSRSDVFEAPKKRYRIHDEDRETVRKYKK